MESSSFLVMLVVLAGVLLVQPWEAEAGCSDLGLCCHGKNVTCRASGPRMNSPTSRACFCDDYCLKIGDCCTDYETVCTGRSPPVDCRLGPWNPWTDCNKDCGWGHKTRNREIKQKALNGGKVCEVTDETSYCYGWSCKKPRHSGGLHELRETGKIIPAQFGTWRKNKLYDPYSDIRRNLFFHYSANQIIKRPPYCAKFEISRTRHACQGPLATEWSRQLKQGQTVCVECQQFAMKRKLGVRCKGHGVYLQETRWSAYTTPGCHGQWIMKQRHEECTCDPKHDLSYILV
jgi:hypothetical protein